MTRPTQGREPNKQIIRARWDLGASKAWKVYDAPTWRLPFRAHLSTRIPADCLIVEADRPFLFWMQMRQGSTAPTIQQMALLGKRKPMTAYRDAGGWEMVSPAW